MKKQTSYRKDKIYRKILYPSVCVVFVFTITIYNQLKLRVFRLVYRSCCTLFDNFSEKKAPTQVFSCEFCEFLRTHRSLTMAF